MQAYKTATAGCASMQPRLHPNIDAWKDIYHGWLVKIKEWRTADSTKTGEIVEIIIEPEEVKSHLRTAIKLASPGFADLIFPMGFFTSSLY